MKTFLLLIHHVEALFGGITKGLPTESPIPLPLAH